MYKYLNKSYLPPMLGSSMEYYDIALYIYMAPILTQVFLPDILKTKQFFIYFFIEFLASIMQILGAKFYGRIGDLVGRKKAIVSAMQGVFLITLMIIFIPTYKEAGLISTFLFLLSRLFQSFFIGGEYNGGAIYCLELEKDTSKHGIISGLYCATTAFGILIASIVAAIINYFGSEYFRYAYAVSFLFLFFIYKYKKNMKPVLNKAKIFKEELNNLDNDAKNKAFRNFIVISISALFFGVLYGLPTKVFNSLLPVYFDININLLMFANVVFLFIYIFLLIFAGYMSCKYKAKDIMFYASLITAIVSIPLLILVETKMILMFILAKAVLITLTAFFIGPFHGFSIKLFREGVRYRKISSAYAIGKCLATLILACSFYIFELTHSLVSVGLILTIAAIIMSGALYYADAKKYKLFEGTQILPSN